MAVTGQAARGRAAGSRAGASQEGSAPLKYREFPIRFGRFNNKDRSFFVWIEGKTPGGQMDSDDAAQKTYRARDFWELSDLYAGGPVGLLDMRRLLPWDLLKLGAKLADLALPEGAVRDLFQRSLAALQPDEGLRIRLQFPPVSPLAQLPWEVMALPSVSLKKQGPVPYIDFLALDPRISIVRSDLVKAAPPRRKTLSLSGARAVVALASPQDVVPMLAVENDRKLIDRAVKTINKQLGSKYITVDTARRPTTGRSLEKLFENKSAEIFHYAGHGEYGADIQQGILLLEDSGSNRADYPADSLASLLADGGVRLAVLGSCDGGRRSGQNTWGGIAPTLIQAGIPAVIASQFTINTKNAELLVETVYPKILRGATVDEAVATARRVLFRASQQADEPQSGLKQRDWAALVLYLADEDGVLFELPPTAPAEAPDKQKLRETIIKVGNVTESVVIGSWKNRQRQQSKDSDRDVSITANDLNGGLVIGSLDGELDADALKALLNRRRKPGR